jgi:hypothetical protein
MAQSSQPLFFEPNVQFEKIAAEVMLPEDPNEWPNELMQELFKQVPYVADFEPHVTMDRVDAERGFGFGHVEVQNKTEIQHGADPAAMESAGVKNARIPIIIKDRKLQPLDLLVTADSKVLPLTESRLRSAIFRPQVFDVTGRGPGDMSMVGQLYPPMRNVAGMGGGGATMSVGMGKEGGGSTSGGSILEAIMPSVNESDYNALFAKIAENRGLQAAFSANAGAAPALRALATYEPAPAAKLASAALDRLKPSVAQLRKEAEGYSLKTASHACWMPKTESMSRGEALRMFGSKVVIAADQTGAVTMMPGEGVTEGAPPAEGGEPQQNPEQDKPALITAFGAYKVQNDEGTELLGWVFPNLIDIDGKSLPISLFTNGSAKAVQGDIVGISAGAGSAVPEGPPQGSGCFYQTLANGKTQALVPMTINASMDSPGEGATVYHGETYDGTPVQVSVQPNIQEVTLVDNHLLVPDTFSWLPLDKAQDVHLVENPEAWGAQAEAKQAFATVLLRCGGADSFALEGFPVDKLASDDRQFLTLDDTLFLFAGLGVDLDYAQTKMGEAAAWSRPVPVRVGRYIKTANDLAGQVREKTASVISLFTEAARGLRKDLLKEAAVIPDPMAVDTVLSLGFLNPENLGVFISYMSVIDNAQAKMCELLLAARLGLREVPVGALEKAVKSTEEALEGLKVLAFQKQ